MTQQLSSLTNYQHIFWDFDGVLVDSLHLKGIAFQSLFPYENQDFKDFIYHYHISHPSLTRNEKISHYISNSSQPFAYDISQLLIRFSAYLAKNLLSCRTNQLAVKYLLDSSDLKCHSIISAASPVDIDSICDHLCIEGCFTSSYSLISDKSSLLVDLVSNSPYQPHQILMIGDSNSDLQAANSAGIDFFLWHPRTFTSSLQMLKPMNTFPPW